MYAASNLVGQLLLARAYFDTTDSQRAQRYRTGGGWDRLSSPRGSNRIGEGGALWTLGDCMLNPEGFSSLSLRSAPLKGTPSPLHLLSPWWGKRKLEQITCSMLSEGCPGHLRDSPSFWWTVRCGSFINLKQLTFVSAAGDAGQLGDNIPGRYFFLPQHS